MIERCTMPAHPKVVFQTDACPEARARARCLVLSDSITRASSTMSRVLHLTLPCSGQSTGRIPLCKKSWSRTGGFAVARPALNPFYGPIGASTRGCKRNGMLHTAITSSASSQNSTAQLPEGDTGTCDADRPPFDLNLAVLLAGFAFEVYNSPKVRSMRAIHTQEGSPSSSCHRCGAQ